MHIVTLSFDDGFLASTLETARIYETHGLSSCFNVIATGHLPSFVAPDPAQANIAKGDFALWNELQRRGHEIMPHGYRHAYKPALPFSESRDLIEQCLAVFSAQLDGFTVQDAIFNFPYNEATPELEQWLPSVVRAFRTAGPAINPLPHAGQQKLTTVSFGPGNCEQALDTELAHLLALPSGWLIFNAHGLENEGWGPMTGDYLNRLLDRLQASPSVRILPAGQALHTASA